jgi:acyl transferase domain-containing protein/acyl carrier protein
VNSSYPSDDIAGSIAIVGMACRFPGSADVDAFWRNLRAGRESIVSFGADELDGVVDHTLLSDPNYVRARGVLEGADLFDAGFFGLSPREAELTDPQQRLFLECAWTALEDAGHDPDGFDGTIGVYAGTGWNSYFTSNLAAQPGLLESDAGHQVLLGNEKDNLTTRVSYKLNLTGPSLAVQTGCSSSLVATSLACQALLSYQCDMALAGGVSVMFPQAGYLYRPGNIFSPDGHCRAFDARAEGTVLGSGVGVVALKRLEDALRDGDHIHAVIKGTAVNNDGAVKVGYTAPSVAGQAKCILEANAIAGIAADSIGYVEAHGTATALGDPVEFEALTKAFRQSTSATGFCGLGSVKTNIGHLDAAAGVAGLIKAVLALQHREIPPSLHFERPNPQIDLTHSPFYVASALASWPAGPAPRRAGVSSFGLGGTNAHVVLEEAPERRADPEKGAPDAHSTLLPLSAKTKVALESAQALLAAHLRAHPELDLRDVAHTLQVGRKPFAHRRVVVARSAAEALRALDGEEPRRVHAGLAKNDRHGAAFLFSGQGAQYVEMGRELYDGEPVFRHHLDRCLTLLERDHGLELRALLYPSPERAARAARELKQTENAQPALFALEYALAQTWAAWGVTMRAGLGHSVGEYVAATLAGVFELEDALALVALRGRLMQALPSGAMLAVALAPEQVEPLLGPLLDLAAVNEPGSSVVSGPSEAVAELQRRLVADGIAAQPLQTSHGFHSRMMDPMLAPFAQRLAQVALRPPSIPFVSCVSGTWITDDEATDPNYWARHVREPVRFAAGLATLVRDVDAVLLEVGPGRTLSGFARRHPDAAERPVVASLGGAHEPADLRDALGWLWTAGVSVDWAALAGERRVRRVRLPTYAFERQRYWAEPPARHTTGDSEPVDAGWRALVDGAARSARGVLAELDRPERREREARVQELCVSYIQRAFWALGAVADQAEEHSLDELARRCGIDARYRQLFAHLVGVLVAHGRLRERDGMLSNLVRCAEEERPAYLLPRIREAGVSDPAALDVLEACGEALPLVLRGELEPAPLFAPVIERALAPAQTAGSLEAGYASIIVRAVNEAVRCWPPGAPLRILEVGGGTGIVTTALLPTLPTERTSYRFTDVGSAFLSRAKQRFARYPFVTYAALDIDRPPAEQGFAPREHDVVIAVNVLHVTRDIGKTLAHVRSLLAPGGLLLMWEITAPAADFALTYSLMMNPLDDGERSQGNPFLRATQWERALREAGFSEVALVPERDLLGGRVVAARASDQPAAAAPLLSLEKKGDLGEWFHVPSWKRASRPHSVVSTESRRWLLFADRAGLGERLAARFAAHGDDVVIVRPGERFASDGAHAFTINPNAADDYRLLLGELRARALAPTDVAQLWGLDDGGSAGLVGVDLRPLHALLNLAQVLGEDAASDALSVTLVTEHVHEVTGNETLRPERAMVLGPAAVIALEYPSLACRTVDVARDDAAGSERLIEQLADELRAPSADRTVALRGAHRWVQAVEPVRLPPAATSPAVLARGGVYLITGGLGEIGLAVAGYLARTVGAKLVLTGRSAYPGREEWEVLARGDDERGRIARKLREIEAAGGAVVLESADVADLAAMRAVVDRARERFGRIAGVVHSAGLLGDGAIARKTTAELDAVLRPKVIGARVLAALFADAPLDFLILFSSLSAVKPAFGQFAYAAANNYLDAFAYADEVCGHTLVTTLSWDVWRGEGMAYDATASSKLQSLKVADFARRGIAPDEGAEVFARALAAGVPQLMVSTSDYLTAAASDMAGLYLQSGPRATQPARAVQPTTSAAVAGETPSDTESALQQIWFELLGVSAADLDADFFELGGDSLIGTQVVTRLKSAFGVKMSPKNIYLHPTIRSLAAAVEQALVAQSSSQTLDEVLKIVQNDRQDAGVGA